jgi:hypothetical protein
MFSSILDDDLGTVELLHDALIGGRGCHIHLKIIIYFGTYVIEKQ